VIAKVKPCDLFILKAQGTEVVVVVFDKKYERILRQAIDDTISFSKKQEEKTQAELQAE
jgi:hypothetical protein